MILLTRALDLVEIVINQSDLAMAQGKPGIFGEVTGLELKQLAYDIRDNEGLKQPRPTEETHSLLQKYINHSTSQR